MSLIILSFLALSLLVSLGIFLKFSQIKEENLKSLSKEREEKLQKEKDSEVEKRVLENQLRQKD